VRRGEQGTQIVFWKQHRIQESAAASEEKRDRAVPLLRSFVVFNAEQCDGIAPLPKPDETPRELRYKEAAVLAHRHQVDIRVGGDKAFFSPSLDFIQMPPIEAFLAEEAYWSTLLHELTHWTGHPSRLDRTLTGRFGSMAYAAEELVAEMGSAFLCASLGIEDRLHHPEYIGNWLTVLKGDKRAVFTASSLAQAAADYLRGRREVKASEPEDAGSQHVP